MLAPEPGAVPAISADSAVPMLSLHITGDVVPGFGPALFQPLVEPIPWNEFATPEAQVSKLGHASDPASEGLVYVGLRATEDLSNLADGQNACCALHSFSS